MRKRGSGDRLGAEAEKNVKKGGPMIRVGAPLGTKMEPKMIKKGSEKTARKKEGSRLPFGPLLGAFWAPFWVKNGPGAASERFFGEKGHCEQTLLFTMI